MTPEPTTMAAEKQSATFDRARGTLRSQGARYGPTLGVGRTLARSKRHRKIVRDNLEGITKGNIRLVRQTRRSVVLFSLIGSQAALLVVGESNGFPVTSTMRPGWP